MLWQPGLSSQVCDLFLMKKMHISEYFFVTSYLIIPVTPNKQKNIYTKKHIKNTKFYPIFNYNPNKCQHKIHHFKNNHKVFLTSINFSISSSITYKHFHIL